MTYLIKPKFHHPDLPKNELGYTHRDYEGSVSTLCAGCGHDSISGAIIEACYELSIAPHRVAKLSGIGCSSKTPTYFLGNSHGFNSVHGRMPSVLTGANLANRDLIYLGVSGDGDSASIGFGQFAHSIRRGVNMTYIVENNGVYGLTKGQFSATADRGSKSKKGVMNTDNAIDLVAMALQLGASFVARSFSGDKSQLVPLIAAAIQHKGAAFIDVISPCVAFNNHAGSTKSFDYVREHNDAVNRLDVITGRDPITVDYAPGTVQVVEQHDGTRLALRKIDADYDAHDRLAAMTFLQKHAAKGQIVTGLLYVDPESEDMHSHLDTVETPLNALDEKALCPGSAALDKINASLRQDRVSKRPSPKSVFALTQLCRRLRFSADRARVALPDWFMQLGVPMVLSVESEVAHDISGGPIDVISTGAALGAEIRGVDLKDLDQSQFAALKRAWHDHQVILVRGQTLSDHDLIAFSRRFGDLDWAPVQETGRRFVEGLPEIYIVSNVTVNGQPIGSLGAGEAVWHTDMSYLDVPPMASMLYALEVPPTGGNTSFCSMYAVYQALPDKLKRRIANLKIKHDGTYNSGGYLRQGVTATDDPRTSPGAIHPLVCTHPDTGRRMLYLGRRRNAYLMGLELADSEALLDELWDYVARPQFAWEHVWRVGDLVLWDNRCTMHRRDPFDASARRIMHRTQIKGSAAPV